MEDLAAHIQDLTSPCISDDLFIPAFSLSPHFLTMAFPFPSILCSLYFCKASFILSEIRWALISQTLHSVLLPVALANAARILGKVPERKVEMSEFHRTDLPP